MILKTEKVTENNMFFDKINALAKEAFPPEEYLDPKKLVEMTKSGDTDFFALKDDGRFVGFMVIKLYADMEYLFFLAIEKDLRSKGYGKRALETIKSLYPNKKKVVDFEMVDGNAENYVQRQKRREFYLKNGYDETGLFLSYLGVDYEVFCMEKDFEEETFKAMMKTIKIDGFEPRYFRK